MKKLINLVLCSFLLIGCSAATSDTTEENTNLLTDGTFSTTTTGMGGEFEVSVVVSDGRISDIQVGENSETGGVGSIAIEKLPERIVESQSLSVDLIAGATVTSNAIINGVKTALSNAGFDISSLTANKEKNIAEGEDETVDVVIVGAGLSGLMAAYELKNNYPDVSYIVLERLDYITGSLPFAGGAIVGLKSTYLESQGMESTLDDLYDVLEGGSGHSINEEYAADIYSYSEEVMNRYIEWGMPILDAELSNPMYSSKLACLQADSSGSDFALFVQQHVKEDEINLRTHSNVTSLIVNDGSVIGVTVEDAEKTYNIYANAVLLATGGFGSNEDLVAKYAPEFKDALSYCGANGNGSGFELTAQFNPEIVGQGMMGAELVSTYAGDYNMGGTVGSYFVVNQYGERFTKDDNGTDMVVQASKNNYKVFNILDSKCDDTEGIEEHLADGSMKQYNSIEELADDMGIDLDGLQKTIEKFNQTLTSNGTDEYGIAVNAKTIDTAPYYAEQLSEVGGYFGSIPGVKVDNGLHLIDGNGNIVEGLYCSGELTEGNLWENDYPGSGIAISYASYSGAAAANSIVNDISSK